MNEVVALLADAAPFRGVEATRIRAAALALEKAVLYRGGRLLVYADAPTVALLAVHATQYRAVQALETIERRIPPLILVGGLTADSAEDRLLLRGADLLADDLGELERFGIVERIAQLEGTVVGAYNRYAPVAVFLIGRGERLAAPAAESLRYHLGTQIPLYSTAEAPWTGRWERIDEEEIRSAEWMATLEGRPLQGEDAELAARADSDARLALELETIINRLLPRTRQ